MGIMDIIRKMRAERAAGKTGPRTMHPNYYEAMARVRQLAVSRRRVRFLADGSRVIRKRPRHDGLPICLPRAVRGVAGKAVPSCR